MKSFIFNFQFSIFQLIYGKVIIIGGGPAGCEATHQLASQRNRRGISREKTTKPAVT